MLSQHFVWVVALVMFVLLLALFSFVSKTHRKRESRLIAYRASETPDQFLASFPEELRPIASAVYKELQQFTYTKKVPLRKTDNIIEMLNVDPDDVHDAMKRLSAKFNCQVPTEVKSEPRTIQDVVERIHQYSAK